MPPSFSAKLRYIDTVRALFREPLAWLYVRCETSDEAMPTDAAIDLAARPSTEHATQLNQLLAKKRLRPDASCNGGTKRRSRSQDDESR